MYIQLRSGYCKKTYLHSSSSSCSRPVGFLAMRSRHSWLSTNDTEDHSIPSASYSTYMYKQG